jgi:hypothetical protein
MFTMNWNNYVGEYNPLQTGYIENEMHFILAKNMVETKDESEQIGNITLRVV